MAIGAGAKRRKALPRKSTRQTDARDSTGGLARVGIGFDVHRLERGRRLMIGGVELKSDYGTVGHSDGDALAHAICDALLGAAGLGDIGTHFPDADARWKGISSLVFLERTADLLAESGLAIAWIDAIVILERPKLGPHFPAMRQALAKALNLASKRISLKAKTHEGLGEIGRGEAIAAQAVAGLGAASRRAKMKR